MLDCTQLKKISGTFIGIVAKTKALTNATADLIQSGYRYAMSLTHNKHDAEDLIQQACLRVLGKTGILNDHRYLLVTVRNLFYDQLRRKEKFREQSVENHDALEGAQVDHTSATESRMDLHSMLAKLTPPQRESLFLNCVEGYTAEEIGKMTGQPRGTVLSHLSRAKKLLAERYRDLALESES